MENNFKKYFYAFLIRIYSQKISIKNPLLQNEANDKEIF